MKDCFLIVEKTFIALLLTRDYNACPSLKQTEQASCNVTSDVLKIGITDRDTVVISQE